MPEEQAAVTYYHYLGEIRMIAFSYAPGRDWALCNGQQIAISQNEALYALLGTTYGGDGKTFFNLPNMQGRIPLHAGNGPNLPPYALGQTGGAVSAQLTPANLPQHTHPFAPACGWNTPIAGNTQNPTGAIPAMVIDSQGGTCTPYTTSNPTGTMLAQTTGPSGSTNPSPVATLPPYMAIYYIIALFGNYPPRP